LNYTDFELSGEQVGTSVPAHRLLGLLAGREDNSEDNALANKKAPFDKMKHAYLFAFILGLSAGKKSSIITDKKNYATLTTIGKNVDFKTLLLYFGEEEDMKDKASAIAAIERYATWGLLELSNAKIGNEYRISNYLEKRLKRVIDK